MDTIHSINLVVSNPEVRNGRPCIAGATIRVTDIVMAHLFHQQAADQLAVGFGLPLAAVYAALACYYEHKEALDEDIRQQIERGRELKEQRLGAKPPFLFG